MSVRRTIRPREWCVADPKLVAHTIANAAPAPQRDRSLPEQFRPRIQNETVAIWHLHARKGLCLFDDVALGPDEGRHRIGSGLMRCSLLDRAAVECYPPESPG